ncbi:hypothetical protein ABIE89_001641 [Bradyrhizobium niftali]
MTMTDQTENTGPKQDARFQPGQSGNPSGRPRGSRNRTTLAVEALLDGEAETLTRKAIDLAVGGDIQALRICLDRLCPPRREATVTFELPKIETVADAVKAMAAIVAAVADGDLTPGEAQAVSGLVQNFSKAVETADLEARITKLEKANDARN